MIQQSHFWVFIQKNLNQDLEEIFALTCSLQPYSNSQDVETIQKVF